MNGLLLFKLRYIGDVLLTTPAIRLLRRSFPQADLTMVVNQSTEDVLRHNPHLDRVLTVDKAAGWRGQAHRLRELRRRRYDAAVDFASGDRAAWLAWAAGAPVRVGLAWPTGVRRFLFNRRMPYPQPTIHAVELCLALVREAFGVTTDDKSLELHTGPEDERFADEWLTHHGMTEGNFVIVHAGGRYPPNRWPQENWARLAETLPLPVVFVGSAADVVDVGAVLGQTGAKERAQSAAGQTSVLQLAALARRAAACVGNDSGPMHIAAAMGTPVVGLFGPTSDPAAWGPWGDRHQLLPTSSSVGAVRAAVITSASVPRAGHT